VETKWILVSCGCAYFALPGATSDLQLRGLALDHSGEE
jgi:hypothetical protein